MIDVTYVKRMAQYNRWQNENLYRTAGLLTSAELTRQRGAFFGSIQGTFSHLMWVDQLWMSRFRQTPRPPGTIPESASLYHDWQTLKSQRAGFDAEIIGWAAGISPEWLTGELTYFSKSAAQNVTGPRWMYVTHFFNHQTHHRGQIHCLLTQTGLRPQDTDLSVMLG
jgi:uncharacterized damage-inducible protein DinB